MDIDTMQRQVSELMAFKAMAMPILAQMQGFMASHQTDQAAEVKIHDGTISSDLEFEPATDDIHEINAALDERDNGTIEATETEQHDG